MNPAEYPPKNKPEQLNSSEKFEAILSLFGSDVAREAFVGLCKEYTEARNKANLESYATDFYVRRQAIVSSPKQAILHNRIMDALTRIASQAPTISPAQREVLREMHDRELTAKLLKEHFSHGKAIREEEEDGGTGKGKKNGMSEVAYYHSLGKGG